MRLSVLLLLIPIALVCPAAAQGPPAGPAEVVRARQQVAAKDYAGAIATLEGFFQANPTAVQGRLVLADAHRGLGHLDRAIELYLAIQQPTAIRLQATFNAAALVAKKGETARALELLGRLKASGTWDMDLVDTSGDFASLAGHPKLASARFLPSDFAAPFVEPVRVLHEWVGETKGDQFSWIARSVPDTDGDGVRDVITSAPTFGAGPNPTGPGKVYLYSGKTAALRWARVGAGTESLGTGLEGAGDVNRDGIADVIAGAPTANRAYVFSGKDGSTLWTLAPNAQAGDRFGASAAGVGDQDGDGYPDLMVGAPGAAGAFAGAGKAYLFSGRDGSTLRVFEGDTAGSGLGSIVAGDRASGGAILIGAPGAGPTGRGRVYVYARQSSTPKFIVESDGTGAALGAMFTSVVGDVDGDRVPDIYASDFANSANGPSTGRVYLHSGADGRRLRTLTGEGAGNGFGIGSADIGDVDRDGFDDLVIGAWQFAGVAPSGGKIYLYSGKDSRQLGTITGRIPGETLGFDATGAGDVDGDGVIDLLVTSSWSNVRGFRSGRMFVVSGATVLARPKP